MHSTHITSRPATFDAHLQLCNTICIFDFFFFSPHQPTNPIARNTKLFIPRSICILWDNSLSPLGLEGIDSLLQYRRGHNHDGKVTNIFTVFTKRLHSSSQVNEVDLHSHERPRTVGLMAAPSELFFFLCFEQRMLFFCFHRLQLKRSL